MSRERQRGRGQRAGGPQGHQHTDATTEKAVITPKLPVYYITTYAEAPHPHQNQPPHFVVWREALFILTAGLFAFMIQLPLISFGAEWGVSGRVTSVHLDGIVSRWAPDDVGLYIGPTLPTTKAVLLRTSTSSFAIRRIGYEGLRRQRSSWPSTDESLSTGMKF